MIRIGLLPRWPRGSAWGDRKVSRGRPDSANLDLYPPCTNDDVMISDAQLKELKWMDRRTVERRIRDGLITQQAYDAFLASLPDVSDRIAPPDIDEGDLAAETVPEDGE